MTRRGAALRAMTSVEAPPPVASLTAPASLDRSGAGELVSSLTSASFTPSAGALLIGVSMMRDDVANTWQTPVASGINLATAWAIRQIGNATSQPRYIQTAIVMAVVTDTPGTGTIEFISDNITFNMTYELFEVTGIATDPSLYPWATGTTATSTLNLDLAASPAASSLIFTAFGQQVDDASTPPSGHTAFDIVPQGSNASHRASYKLENGAQNNFWSVAAGRGQAGLIIEIPWIGA